MKMLNVFEVAPENCVRIISNVTLFDGGSCLHDNSSVKEKDLSRERKRLVPG